MLDECSLRSLLLNYACFLFYAQVAHNPLQFVAARSAATALSEKAKQQLTVTEQQKRIREELRKNMVIYPFKNYQNILAQKVQKFLALHV